MKAIQIPAKFPLVWGASATSSYIRSIPATTSTPGAASLQLGFPPITFQNEATGGIPLDGRDENGILNQITAWSQWQNMGGPVTYDAGFSTSIGGYPQGAWLYAAAGDGWNATIQVLNPSATNCLQETFITASTTSSITLTNLLLSTGTAAAWPSGTTLIITATAY